VTPTHRDVPRTLHEKHAQLEHDLAERAKRILVDHITQTAPDPSTPAGRRRLRGIPVVGMGGLDARRDPLLVILDDNAEDACAA
jgi:hypothetical protein